MAGYSGTPLVKKLGLKEGHRIAFPNEPADFAATLGPLPAGVIRVDGSTETVDLAVLFCRDQAALDGGFVRMADRLESDGALWVAWPKRASGVPTDLNDNVVRTFGLEAGLVDVKVCAIDDVWSGLKFVYRKKDRPARRPD